MIRRNTVHRWIATIVGAQLLLWSVGGFVFATHDIAWVRGEEGRVEAHAERLDLEAVRLTPAEAAAASGHGADARAIVLRSLLGDPVYEVRPRDGGPTLIDARDGSPRPIDEDVARRIARADRRGSPEVRGAALLTSDPPTEYRSGPLPAWRVELADVDDTHVYVRADTGEITARRNRAWRRFDFFWMLHTMDYGGRDNFNHPLLIVASLLAMLAILTGFFMWGPRLRRAIRRRSPRS